MQLARKIGSLQFGMVALAAVAVLGVLLSLQGWRSRTPSYDLLTTIDASHTFLRDWKLPDRGVLTSFGSFAPPGAAWLMIPGLIVFDDARLYEYVGSIAMYAGTLAGIFMLGRIYLGSGAALFSVGLYGLSQLGLSVADSLEQRYPIHFFYVWMVFLLGKWVAKQNATFLAAAVLVWATGMYVFLEIAPAIMIVPVVWFLYRPALRMRPVVALGALAAMILIWYPYLKFESGRGYIDLESQVRRQVIFPANFQGSWCDPSLLPATWRPEASPPGELAGTNRSSLPAKSLSTRAEAWVSQRAGLVVNGFLISNFKTGAKVPGVSAVLLVLTLAGMFLLSFPHREAAEIKRRQNDWKNWAGCSGAAAIACGLLFNEWILARYLAPDGSFSPSTATTLRIVQAVLIVGGILLITIRIRIAAVLGRFSMTSTLSPHMSILPVSLAVPWLVLIAISDSERLERFWWLWPLQILTLASVFTSLAGRLQIRSWLKWAGALAVFFAVVTNGFVMERLDTWTKTGWSGNDAPEITLVDYIGEQVHAQGRSNAAIGYEIFTYHFPAVFHSVDSRYKVGAMFDSLLQYRKRIANSNRCAEGLSSKDEFRVVQTSADGWPAPALNRIVLVREPELEFRRDFGPYRIFQRRP